MAPVPATGLATTTASGVGVQGGLGEWPPGRLWGWRRPNSRAGRRSRGRLCPTVQEHYCARRAGIAGGRAWTHGDRAASSAIASENKMKWNSVTIHAKFAPISREIRESACLTECEAFANAQHNVAKFTPIRGRRQCIPHIHTGRSLSTSLTRNPLPASTPTQRGAAAGRGPDAWGAV